MDLPELEHAAKTDAEQLLADNKAVIDAIEGEETQAAAYVSAHMAWVIGLACALAGYILGSLLPFRP